MIIVNTLLCDYDATMLLVNKALGWICPPDISDLGQMRAASQKLSALALCVLLSALALCVHESWPQSFENRETFTARSLQNIC